MDRTARVNNPGILFGEGGLLALERVITRRQIDTQTKITHHHGSLWLTVGHVCIMSGQQSSLRVLYWLGQIGHLGLMGAWCLFVEKTSDNKSERSFVLDKPMVHRMDIH